MTPRNLPEKRRPRVVLVVCMNLDSFHGFNYGEIENEATTRHPAIFIQYIVWLGSEGRYRWKDEPSWEECCAIVNSYPKDEPIHVVRVPCRYCRKRGVKS